MFRLMKNELFYRIRSKEIFYYFLFIFLTAVAVCVLGVRNVSIAEENFRQTMQEKRAYEAERKAEALKKKENKKRKRIRRHKKQRKSLKNKRTEKTDILQKRKRRGETERLQNKKRREESERLQNKKREEDRKKLQNRKRREESEKRQKLQRLEEDKNKPEKPQRPNGLESPHRQRREQRPEKPKLSDETEEITEEAGTPALDYVLEANRKDYYEQRAKLRPENAVHALLTSLFYDVFLLLVIVNVSGACMYDYHFRTLGVRFCLENFYLLHIAKIITAWLSSVAILLFGIFSYLLSCFALSFLPFFLEDEIAGLETVEPLRLKALSELHGAPFEILFYIGLAGFFTIIFYGITLLVKGRIISVVLGVLYLFVIPRFGLLDFRYQMDYLLHKIFKREGEIPFPYKEDLKTILIGVLCYVVLAILINGGVLFFSEKNKMERANVS